MLRGALVSLFLALLVVATTDADEVEFLSGAKVQGKVKEIHKAERKITFDTTIGGRQLTRTYKYSAIHAVTMNGKRYVINEKGSSPSTPAGSGGSSGSTDSGRRTRSDVLKAIEQAGRTAPDWYESTNLQFPQTLDLKWPMPPPQPWNNRKNVGQYVWDVINPNPSRWRSGIRLMHHLLSMHKDNRELQKRIMKSLGAMYFRFFQDYARAAFWWRQAGVGAGDPDSVGLAESYWRLGNKQMAVELLNQRTIYLGLIKLWGDMGEKSKAIDLADRYVRAGGRPHEAYLLAGDACRLASDYDLAMRYYNRVISTAASGNNAKRADRVKQRARANLEAVKLFELTDLARVADGAYQDNSLGYEGQIFVEVVVKNQRIESVKVTKHREKQFYSAIRDVPAQIIEKQGVKGVDATSRATITAEAIINATAKALAKGVK